MVFSFPAITRWGTGDWRHRGEYRECPKNQEGLPLFRPADVRGPARWFLGFAIEEWLRFLETFRRPIVARVVWSERDHQPRFVFGPRSLLGAMVCQLAAAVHGTWPFQECAFCHKFFRLAPTAWNGMPLGWAEHYVQEAKDGYAKKAYPEIAAYLRERHGNR